MTDCNGNDNQISIEKKASLILIVEDNPVNQRVFSHFMQILGYSSFVVGNGKDALEAIESVHFSAVLLDIGLPDIGGEEVCKIIRNGIYQPNIPIIAISAHADLIEKELIEAGVSKVFTKPVSIQQLEDAFIDLGVA